MTPEGGGRYLQERLGRGHGALLPHWTCFGQGVCVVWSTIKCILSKSCIKRGRLIEKYKILALAVHLGHLWSPGGPRETDRGFVASQSNWPSAQLTLLLFLSGVILEHNPQQTYFDWKFKKYRQISYEKIYYWKGMLIVSTSALMKKYIYGKTAPILSS